MFRYIIQRLLASIAVLFLVLTVTFFLIQFAPGGLDRLMDPNMTPEDAQRIARNLGLDQPAHVQYGRWLTRTLQGDLGRSLSYGRPVLPMVTERLPATLLLAGAALALSVIAGIPLGAYAALKQNSLIDHLISFSSFVGLAAPNFWVGILAIILFSVNLGWLPTSGMSEPGANNLLLDRSLHLIMPALVLATSFLAQIIRYTRSTWLELFRMDYVNVARAKGLSPFPVQAKHVFRNALIPIVTVIGTFLPLLVGGAAVVETLFSWPGMGSLAVDAALRRDTPLILGVTVVVSIAVILSNLVIDLLYPLIDPRIRDAT